VVAVALAALAAAAGFLIGGSGSGSGPEAGRFANSASAGSLALSFPDGWRRVADKPNVPGMSFSQPIVLSFAGSSGARLSAGTVGGAGPTLLPQSFLARLSRAPSRDDRVRLGRLEAYRYAGLEPRGAEGPVTVYVAPTTEGVATVACVAPPRAGTEFGAECERVASTLALSGGDPLPLGPSDGYARAAGAALRRLDRSTDPLTKRLRGASSPDAQAGAATDLGEAYRVAARSLSRAPVGPLERRANARLVTALREVGSAYTTAARAARVGDDGGYSAAGRSVQRAATGLAQAQRELRELGYSVG